MPLTSTKQRTQYYLFNGREHNVLIGASVFRSVAESIARRMHGSKDYLLVVAEGRWQVAQGVAVFRDRLKCCLAVYRNILFRLEAHSLFSHFVASKLVVDLLLR